MQCSAVPFHCGILFFLNKISRRQIWIQAIFGAFQCRAYVHVSLFKLYLGIILATEGISSRLIRCVEHHCTPVKFMLLDSSWALLLIYVLNHYNPHCWVVILNQYRTDWKTFPSVKNLILFKKIILLNWRGAVLPLCTCTIPAAIDFDPEPPAIKSRPATLCCWFRQRCFSPLSILLFSLPSPPSSKLQ